MVFTLHPIWHEPEMIPVPGVVVDSQVPQVAVVWPVIDSGVHAADEYIGRFDAKPVAVQAISSSPPPDLYMPVSAVQKHELPTSALVLIPLVWVGQVTTAEAPGMVMVVESQAAAQTVAVFTT